MVQIRKLRWKWTDAELVLSGGLTARIVERPGLWMPPSDLGRLLGDLRAIADACVGRGPVRYGILSGAKLRFDSAHITVLYDGCSGCPIAFSAATLLEMTVQGQRQNVLHLGLTMVVPTCRGRSLCRTISALASFLLLLRNRLRPIWITNVTQVPAAFGTVAELFANVFPTADPRRRPTEAHLAIAHELIRHHRSTFGVGEDAEFDEEHFIITNAYTGGSAPLKKSFAEAPQHRNRTINEMCRTRLNYERGDDFLQVGQLTVGAAVRQLLNGLPLSRITALPAAGGFRELPGDATQ